MRWLLLGDLGDKVLFFLSQDYLNLKVINIFALENLSSFETDVP